ncbi:hypothetical protein [Flavobacterium aciduliphilum]|uniref:Uncharacterized protein n=1 Tax=Flavobacterium aciduliphilum TaxID=1101402 RepID=A0A328YL18_9FLAO|nr:hypothetical protein [Flavobacterium aciduliphilum]RAR74230.1 hypothetical protein CLV55_102163 [Flavobacterium aciduliphilum]
MSFQELYSNLQECERDQIFLLSGDTISNDLKNHLSAINDTIFDLSHKVFLASKKENIYWSYCSTETYFKNYDNRLNEFLNNDFNEIHNEIEFIESEINILKNSERNFSNTNYHPDLIYPIRKKIKLLENKMETLNPSNVEKLIDYSDTSCGEKIIFLHQVGVLDYLKKLSPFNLSINKLAEYLSAITGENATTLQSYINPIFSPTSGQKNNPLNSNPAVKKVSKKLADMGFSANKTN